MKVNQATIDMLVQNYPFVALKDQHGAPNGVYLTGVARMAFAKLAEPDDKGKYGCALIFPASYDLGVLKQAASDAATAKWGPAAATMKLRSPFKAQADMAAKYEGFGQTGFYVDAYSKFLQLYASDGKTKIEPRGDIIWSGCWVRAGLTTYTYDKDGQGKPVTPGVSFGLSFLQFVCSDEKFSKGVDAAEYLTPIAGLPGSVPAAASNGVAGPVATAPAPIRGGLF